MFGVDLAVVAILALVVAAGALVQGIIGLGLGLVAAPIMTMLAPELVPVTLLVLSLLLPVITLMQDRSGIDWRGLAWAVPGRLPGTIIGAWLVTSVPRSTLGAIVALAVLAAVGLTWRTVTVPITPGTLTAAGLISGVTGTATSIGGPPLALLYQHRRPEVIRSTLAVYFILGAVLSLAGIWVGGGLEAHMVGMGVVLAPALGVGLLAAKWVRARVDPSAIRPAVLLLCAASAIVLLIRSLAG